jgi:hypothetical protein
MTAIVTENIRGQDYKLIKLDPLEAGRLATKVAQNLAGALDDVEVIKSLISSSMLQKDEESDKEVEQPDGDKKDVGKILEKLMESPQLISALAGGIAKVDAESLYDCALKCVRGRVFAGQKLHDDNAINAWFADHPDHLLLVLVWALKTNVAGFFAFGGKG